MTTNQAAERLKITRDGVLKLLKRGLLKGDKPGRDWTVSESSVKRYQDERKAPGWPKRR